MDYSILANLVIDSKQISCTKMIKDHYEGISDMCVSPFNPALCTAACFDKTLTEYDITASKPTRTCTLSGHEQGIWTCDYSPSTQGLIASAGSDKTVRLWDINSQKCTKVLKNHSNSVYDVQFSTDGKYLGSCAKENICVWDMANLSKPLDIITCSKKNPNNGFIYCLNFINDNQEILTGFIDGTILSHKIGTSRDNDKIFSILPNYIETYKEEDLYSKCVYSLAKFNNNDSKIMLSHSDGSVRIFEMGEDSKKMKKIDEFFYFTASVTCSDISSDDKTIIACGKDRTSRIWNLDTHKEIKYSLSGHTGFITSCKFVKNGRNDIVVTGSYDNTVRVWNLN